MSWHAPPMVASGPSVSDARAAFERTRRALVTGRRMIDGIEAEGFLSDLETYLRVEGIDGLRFTKGADARYRFEGTARLTDVPARVGRRLVREWLDELAVKESEAHLTEIDADALTFEFVTWSERIGCASGRLVARRGRSAESAIR
jgi:hypothetical protein